MQIIISWKRLVNTTVYCKAFLGMPGAREERDIGRLGVLGCKVLV